MIQIYPLKKMKKKEGEGKSQLGGQWKVLMFNGPSKVPMLSGPWKVSLFGGPSKVPLLSGP